MPLASSSRPDSHAWLDAVLLLTAAGILAWQLLLPGFIGLANNGDFPKVAGPLCLAGIDHETQKFHYFQPMYARGRASCYNPGIPSSEIVPAWVASSVERIAGDKTRFDIRWLGAVHAAIFIAIYACILSLLRNLGLAARVILALAGLWIFADTGFVAYLNSFYSDVAAMLGGLGAIFMAVYLALDEQNRVLPAVGFGLASLFFVTSKAQHGVFGFVLLAVAIGLALQSKAWRRLAAAAAVIAIAGGMIWVIGNTPSWYTAQSRFTLIFTKLVANPQTPAGDLRELGLDPGDIRYAGMHAFMEDSPLNDPAFRDRFYAHTSYRRVLQFYMRHPRRVIGILESDLRLQAPLRRVYGNFPKTYGLPPGAESERFSTWSDLRTKLFVLWPEHIVVWYAAIVLCGPWLARRQAAPLDRALLWAILTVAIVGVGEFCLASLADAGETYRHLWMFHVLTDATIYLAFVYVANKASQSEILTLCKLPLKRSPRRMRPSMPHTTAAISDSSRAMILSRF